MYSFVGGQEAVWPKIEELGKAVGKKIGAIAYLTDISKVKFRRGDILVVDASDHAIKMGQTSCDEIKRLRKHVHIFSFAGLHAKTLVIGNTLIVGSMNASNMSQKYLTEVALITDDRRAVNEAKEWLDSLIETATAIDNIFIARISKIRVLDLPKPPAGMPRAPPVYVIQAGLMALRVVQ